MKRTKRKKKRETRERGERRTEREIEGKRENLSYTERERKQKRERNRKTAQTNPLCMLQIPKSVSATPSKTTYVLFLPSQQQGGEGKDKRQVEERIE